MTFIPGNEHPEESFRGRVTTEPVTLTEAMAVATRLEWIDNDGGLFWARCPECFSSRDAGHSETCELGALLARYREQEVGHQCGVWGGSPASLVIEDELNPVCGTCEGAGSIPVVIFDNGNATPAGSLPCPECSG